MVIPDSRISFMRVMHLRLNGRSPTASTSSAMKMSQSTCTATENPSRANMPEE